MPIQYKKAKVKDLKFNDDDFLVFPTDYKIKMFPKTLKSFIPTSFEVFKELSNFIKVNNADVPKAFFFPPLGNLKLVTVVCVDEKKLIEYEDLFNSLNYINDDNGECNIYIMEEWFGDYLSNFEAFEYDLEKTFANEPCTIIIVNSTKDYKYDEPEKTESPTTSTNSE
jgi:hypothetical protein